MSHTRLRVLFILLVLILLMASAVFGVLTYWLGGQPGPASAPGGASVPVTWGLAKGWQEDPAAATGSEAPRSAGRG